MIYIYIYIKFHTLESFILINKNRNFIVHVTQSETDNYSVNRQCLLFQTSQFLEKKFYIILMLLFIVAPIPAYPSLCPLDRLNVF